MLGAIAPDSPAKALRRELSFAMGCGFELLLAVLALAWGWFFDQPVFTEMQWSLNGVVVGIAAVIPPLAFFVWTLKSNLRLWRHHRELLESLFRPLFGRWSLLQLLAISLIAGVSEEAFFRGAVQGSLSERVGVILALVLASGLFGACHLLTWTYAVIAAVIGAYLGLLWVWTGNLLTPMVTHAVYDLAALVYFLRVYRSE